MALRTDRESGHCCTHVTTTDLSDRILRALTEALSGAGFRLVTEVEVRRGWGDIYLVSIHTGLSRTDASPAFEQTIHEVVDTVLAGERHLVEIRWTGF